MTRHPVRSLRHTHDMRFTRQQIEAVVRRNAAVGKTQRHVFRITRRGDIQQQVVAVAPLFDDDPGLGKLQLLHVGEEHFVRRNRAALPYDPQRQDDPFGGVSGQHAGQRLLPYGLRRSPRHLHGALRARELLTGEGEQPGDERRPLDRRHGIVDQKDPQRIGR